MRAGEPAGQGESECRGQGSGDRVHGALMTLLTLEEAAGGDGSGRCRKNWWRFSVIIERYKRC